jgi:protein PhnA
MAEQAQDDGTGIIGKRKVPEGIPNPSLPPSTPGNRRGGSGKFGGGNTGITGKLILGQDRLNAYLSKNPYQEGTFEYDRYIANAPAFPDDAAYTAAIEPLRKAAKDRIASGVYKDANGNILQDGDSVSVIKDLKLKGSSGVVKQGTKVKNIRLVDEDHDIDCKIDGFGAMKLKSEYVKKVS